ncbi:MAG TPA: orotidine 5'-phosphate decarboxylase [archaeon]|jgi:3-hexulose-6-phosphate synthase|nr:orotidine 5'-phosphate decarboxylase [archaeon]HPV66564.1 orotidine 5'-phosphate decarboxylase [archaeon]
MKLQLALDVTDKKKAIELCKKVSKYIDVIELGTPFIKIYGLNGLVKDFKKLKKPVLTDLKTMDTGYFEAELAFKAGADYSTVCASAYIETIKGTIKAAKDYKKKSLVDLIGTKDPIKSAKEILKYKPDYIGIHSGIDMQQKGIKPLKTLINLSKIMDSKKIAIAGGINLETIEEIAKYKPGIIIVGGAITNAKDPVAVAKKMKEIMEKYE